VASLDVALLPRTSASGFREGDSARTDQPRNWSALAAEKRSEVRVMGLLQFFRSSQQRKRELLRISRILGQPISSAEILLGMSKDSALEELPDLILGDSALFGLLQKLGATREDLRELYWALLAAGAGQWV
jgi:hypothetical protein